MKAITVRQPWAECIARGVKLVENRSPSVPHKYRGPLMIHAAQQWSGRGSLDGRVLAVAAEAGWPIHPPTRERIGSGPWQSLPPYVEHPDHWAWDTHMRQLYMGAFIAVAQLVDAHPDAGCCQPWGEREYTDSGGNLIKGPTHLILEDVKRLAKPTEARGHLGLWSVPALKGLT